MGNLYYFLTIGGSQIKSSLSGSTSTDGINTFLKNCGVAVGAIIIALAAIKMIVALVDENVVARQRASLLLSVGLVFVSINTILTSILGSSGIDSSTSYTTVAKNILTLIGTMTTWAGGMMLLFGAFTYVMAITHESADQQAKATNSIMVGLGFITIKTLCETFATNITNNTTAVKSYAREIIEWLTTIVSWAGYVLLPLAILKLVMSVRTEDLKERGDAIKLLGLALGLLSFTILVKEIRLADFIT